MDAVGDEAVKAGGWAGMATQDAFLPLEELAGKTHVGIGDPTARFNETKCVLERFSLHTDQNAPNQNVSFSLSLPAQRSPAPHAERVCWMPDLVPHDVSDDE